VAYGTVYGRTVQGCYRDVACDHGGGIQRPIELGLYERIDGNSTGAGPRADTGNRKRGRILAGGKGPRNRKRGVSLRVFQR